jgi:hypothetical protein
LVEKSSRLEHENCELRDSYNNLEKELKNKNSEKFSDLQRDDFQYNTKYNPKFEKEKERESDDKKVKSDKISPDFSNQNYYIAPFALSISEKINNNPKCISSISPEIIKNNNYQNNLLMCSPSLISEFPSSFNKITLNNPNSFNNNVTDQSHHHYHYHHRSHSHKKKKKP